MPVPGAPRRVASYNLAAVILTIGIVSVSNYGPDGGIDFDAPANIVDSEVSADGFVTYVVQSDERLNVTIRLSETSQAVAPLMALFRTQIIALYAGLGVAPIPFRMQDPSTGDVIASGTIVLIKEPFPTKAKGLSVREFAFEIPYGRFRQNLGDRSLLGAIEGLLNTVA